MKLHLTKIGNEKNPPIIFLHGLFGQGDDFLNFANILSDRYYSILIDLPGHGKSEVFTENSFSNLCNLVLDSIPETSQRPSLVGYSLGGRIALYLITNFPQFFNKVMIISANPGLELGREDRLRGDLFLLEDISSPEEFFLDWYSKPLFGDLVKHKDFSFLMEKRRKTNLDKIKVCLGSFSMGNQPSLWEKLQENSLPLLYLWGEKDHKYKKIGQRLGQNPLINLIEFENAGHYLHFEYPTFFHNQLEIFLKQ